MSFAEVKWGVDQVLKGFSADIPSGLTPKKPDDFRVLQATNNRAAIYVSASDTILDNETLASIKEIRVVRKTTGYPTSITDGTVVLSVDANNLTTYATNPYYDEGLTRGATYYYQAFTISEGNAINGTILSRQKLTCHAVVYGYKINKYDSNPATRVIYTDDSLGFTPMAVNKSTGDYSLNSWKDTFIINSFRPVMLKYDGTVDYELNHDDQTKKLDGTASDISNTSYGGNAMVEVSKMWFKRWEDTNYEYCQVSNEQVDSSFHCYAHMRDANTELDHIYLPMFKGSNISSKLRSIAGQAPINSQTGATEVQYAQANGTNWYINDWSNYKMIEDLLILLGRNTNSQATFGNGHYSGGSGADSLLTTGTLKSKGMFYGTSGNVAVKVFWLENWYGDRWDRCAGCLNVNGTVKVKPYKPYNATGTDYISIGVIPSGSNGGYQSAHKMTEYGLVPKTASGSDSTYIPDGLWFDNSITGYALFGGTCNSGLHAGSSSLALNGYFSSTAWHIGASPSYK